MGCSITANSLLSMINVGHNEHKTFIHKALSF